MPKLSKLHLALLKISERTKETLELQQLLVFVIVAERGETSQSELSDLVGIGQSAVSRNLDVLGPGNPFKRLRGFGLLEGHPDPYNRKARIIRLTDTGKFFWEELKQILGD